MTGADGFVGGWLVPRLVGDGNGVVAATFSRGAARFEGAEQVQLDVCDTESIRSVLDHGPFDAVVHLAAVASGADALGDVGHAWEVNAAGTARLASGIARGSDR